MRNPTSALFSTWNCVPATLPRATMATTGRHSRWWPRPPPRRLPVTRRNGQSRRARPNPRRPAADARAAAAAFHGLQRVPAHLRQRQRNPVRARSRRHGRDFAPYPAEARRFAVLQPALRQDLHADADAEQRHARRAAHPLLQGSTMPGKAEQAPHAGREGALAGKDDALRPRHLRRVAGHGDLDRRAPRQRRSAFQRPQHGGEIARAGIDNGHHRAGARRGGAPCTDTLMPGRPVPRRRRVPAAPKAAAPSPGPRRAPRPHAPGRSPDDRAPVAGGPARGSRGGIAAPEERPTRRAGPAGTAAAATTSHSSAASHSRRSNSQIGPNRNAPQENPSRTSTGAPRGGRPAVPVAGIGGTWTVQTRIRPRASPWSRAPRRVPAGPVRWPRAAPAPPP